MVRTTPIFSLYLRTRWPTAGRPIAPAIAATADDYAKKVLDWYAREGWDAAMVDAHIARAAAWARKHSVRLVCNEWGAYKPKAPREDRLAYLRDVRMSLEKHGIGWTIWNGAFGPLTTVAGRPGVDVEAVKALGLTPVADR